MSGWLVSYVLDHVPWWLYVFAGAVVFFMTVPYWLPIWNVLPNWLRVTLAGTAAVAVAYLAGRNKGASDAAKAREKANADAIKNRQTIDANVGGMGDADVTRGLDKWMRD